MAWDGINRRDDDFTRDLKLEKLNVILDTLTTIVARHEKELHGSPDFEKIGVLTKVDRLEQDKIRHQVTAYTAWSAFIGLSIKTLWDYFVKKG